MLDLVVVSDLIRENTSQALAGDVIRKPAPRRSLQRRGAIRFRSAAVLRGLADRIEPPHTNPVAG